MKNRHFLLSFIIILFTGFIQKDDQDCAKIISDYIDRMSAIDTPKDNQTYFMDMKMQTIYAPETKTASSDVNLKMYLTSKSMIYETDQLAVYQDEDDAFMVIHPQKKIVWNNGGKNPNKDMDKNNLTKSQKALFENSKVKTCEDLLYKGISAKRIQLLVNEEDREALKIKDLTLYFDIKRKIVFEVNINFASKQPVRQQIITYNAIDFNYKKQSPASVKSMIFVGGGKLQPKYKGYTLENNRRT